MPKIDKLKKVKKTKKVAKLVASKPTKKQNLPVAKSSPRKSTPEYYQCLLTQAQQN
jgi:hypothetical protein